MEGDATMFFRMFFGVPGAAIVTAALFLAMAWMIRQQEVIVDPEPHETPRIVRQIIDSELVGPIKRERPKIEAPKPIDTRENIDPIKTTGIPITYETTSSGPGGGKLDFGFTGTQPSVKFAPIYPENCRARGAQGTVLVEFDVTPEGTVINPRVIATENACLDRAAMQTIQKWKFTPKKDDSGRAVAQRGLRQSFNFQLTDA